MGLRKWKPIKNVILRAITDEKASTFQGHKIITGEKGR
jgi:hypothetical protein